MDFLSRNAENLVRIQNAPVTVKTVDEMIDLIQSTFEIDMSTFSFANELDLYKYVINMMAIFMEFNEKSQRAENLLEDIESSFDILNRRIRTVTYEKIKAARLLESNMSNESITKIIDISAHSFDMDNTTAAIMSNKLLGISSENNGANKIIDTSSIRMESLSVQIDDNGQDVYGHIYNKAGNGWNIVGIDTIIEASGTYKAKCETRFNGKKKITIDINLNKKTDIESICPVFVGPEVVKILKSKDGITYTTITSKTISIDTTFTTEREPVQFIRLIVYKDDASFKNGNKYVYEVPLTQIKISSEFEKKEVKFTTKSIDLAANLSKIIIDTKDMYDDNNININYEIKVNDKEWQTIRPVNKTKNRKLSSIINCQEIFDNKIIKITERDLVDGRNRFNLEIPQPFLISNKTRYFTKNQDWSYEEYIYTAHVLSYTEKTIDVGIKTIYINDIEYTGVVTIPKGLTKIGILADDFLKLFNKALVKSYSINGNLITIELASGSTTITDTMYPYNIKLLIEENVDFVFGKELFEVNDIKLERTDNNLVISTDKEVKEVYCCFYNLYSFVDKIQIRGTLKSTNNLIIPEISRIIVRAEW